MKVTLHGGPLAGEERHWIEGCLGTASFPVPPVIDLTVNYAEVVPTPAEIATYYRDPHNPYHAYYRDAE